MALYTKQVVWTSKRGSKGVWTRCRGGPPRPAPIHRPHGITHAPRTALAVWGVRVVHDATILWVARSVRCVKEALGRASSSRVGRTLRIRCTDERPVIEGRSEREIGVIRSLADQDGYRFLFSPFGQDVDEDAHPRITLKGVNSLCCWMRVVHGQLGLPETGLPEFVQSLLSCCALSKHTYHVRIRRSFMCARMHRCVHR